MTRVSANGRIRVKMTPVMPRKTQDLGLDQIGALYEIVDLARRDRLSASDGRTRASRGHVAHGRAIRRIAPHCRPGDPVTGTGADHRPPAQRLAVLRGARPGGRSPDRA